MFYKTEFWYLFVSFSLLWLIPFSYIVVKFIFEYSKMLAEIKQERFFNNYKKN